MNACPFCSGSLYPTFTQGLSREKCGKCDAIWIEEASLANVVGTSAATALVQRTQGKPGKCTKCSAALVSVAQCPQCGHDAPACPQCGAAPMAVAVVEGVRVDVCSGCHGVALDAAGFEQLLKLVAQRRPTRPAPTPKAAPPQLTKAGCSACQRKLLLKHSFTYDNKLFCGSCAPRDATPFDVDMARASPALAQALSTYFTGDEKPPANPAPSGRGSLSKASKPQKD
jgi:Zn-finger nucleic acid-binding protein